MPFILGICTQNVPFLHFMIMESIMSVEIKLFRYDDFMIQSTNNLGYQHD